MNYSLLVESLASIHQETAGRAAAAVNQALVMRNWLIGAHIVEFEQKGEDRARYGAKLLPAIGKDLVKQGIAGCGPRSLANMRLLALTYPQLAGTISQTPIAKFHSKALQAKNSILQTLSAKSPDPLKTRRLKISTPELAKSPTPLSAERILMLPWSVLVELITLSDPWQRAFYENECLRSRWSVRELQRQVGSLLYERTGLSTDKQAVIEAARTQAAQAGPEDALGAIADLIRDPYILEFTGLAEKPRYRETDLEQALLDHLQSFLLELGEGFCLEARQKRITLDNEHDWIDLVFYHRKLRCHLLIDLKTRPFVHGDAGQMNFYLNWWKDHALEDGDRPPVGLILCTDKRAAKAQYATGGLDHQLFVSRYLVALPKVEALQEFLERDRAAWEREERDCEEGSVANGDAEISPGSRPQGETLGTRTRP